MSEKSLVLRNETDLKKFLFVNHQKQIENYFGDKDKAMKFLSAVVSDTQRNPALLECEPRSLVNSYMIMAGCGFMPSGVSGEAYVLPYNNNKKVGNEWVKIKEAQFQMGYQGLVTLFYKAGVTKITSGIVYENDGIEITNDEIKHTVDPKLSKKERGEAIGAYVIVTFRGEKIGKYMNGKDILAHAQKFSKSYKPDGKFSPWNPANDPELTMWTKTVLKQHSKLLPKNETINNAIAADNHDSVMSDRIEAAKRSSESMKMGNLLEHDKNQNQDKEIDTTDSQEAPESHQEPAVEVE
jgi:recombination protein RecT